MSKSNKNLSELKIAITHDYLINFGGAELVLIELLRIFPNADLYTPIAWKKKFSAQFWEEIEKHTLKTSFINNLKWTEKFWKFFLPFHARFFEKQNFLSYDLVISISSGFAKWISIPANAPTKHLAYINTPPRFLWGMDSTIFYKLPQIIKFMIKPVLSNWQKKDKAYVHEADMVIANSTNIKKKVELIYNLRSGVIFPPVTRPATVYNSDQKEFYLIINRLVAYKRIDSIIEAFNKSTKKLVIIGDGPERSNYDKLAKENVLLTGFLDDKSRNRYLAECKAFIYPGEEDFGISMVEAMFMGKPIIAYKKGGSQDIIDENTGVIYEKHDTESILKATDNFETKSFNTEVIRKRAELFSKEVFEKNIVSAVSELFEDKVKN